MAINQFNMESPKKVFRFIWRHFFTMINLSIGFSAFIEGPLNWKNGLYMTIAAAFLDWAKQFIKLTPNPKSRHFYNDIDDAPIHIRQPWNSSIIGTPTHLMNMGHNRYN